MKRTRGGFSENLSYKIVALLITLILWVLIFTSKEAGMDKSLPVQYNIPEEMVLMNRLPSEVKFRILGSRLALKKVSEDDDPLVIDLSTAREGVSTIRIHSENINLPANSKVVSIMPPMITVRLERLISKIVPVEVVTVGKIAPPHRLINVVPQPGIWEIFGPRTEVVKVTKVKTAPLDLSQIQKTETLDLAVDIADYKLSEKSRGSIKVQVKVK